MKIDFLFGIFPYVALGILAAGILLRYLLLGTQTLSGELSQAKAVFASGRLWQVSLMLLFVGHMVLLVAPGSLLAWNSNRTRLYLLEAVALAIGIAALGGWLALMWRSLKRHGGSALAELSDTAMLGLLFIGIFSGLLLAVLYRWGSSWGAMILGPYLASLLRGKPAGNFVAQMPFLVRLHVFSFFAAVAIVPVTRLGSVVLAVLQALLAAIDKPISAAGRGATAWLRKHNPSPLFWPEED